MAVTTSPFCEHKKLRTNCGACKPATLSVDTTLQAVPFRTAEERAKSTTKRARSAAPAAREARTSDQPGAPGVPSHEDVAVRARATGPGKPLLAQRKRTNRNISAAEADAVKPWWVKK